MFGIAYSGTFSPRSLGWSGIFHDNMAEMKVLGLVGSVVGSGMD